MRHWKERETMLETPMTNEEFNVKIDSLRKRAADVVEDARMVLLREAEAAVAAIEAKADVVRRFDRISDLVAAATVFVARPIQVEDPVDSWPVSVYTARGRYFDLDTKWGMYGEDAPPLPKGDYTLVVALVPRAKS